MGITDELQRLGGAARTRALLAHGIREREIARAVATETVRRASRGVLALPECDPRVVAAVALSGRLTCLTALEHHDVLLLARSQRAHVEVPSAHTTATRKWSGVHRHYRKDAAGPDVLGPPVASVVQALDDAGRCLGELAHLVAVDSALHRGLIAPSDIATFASSTVSRRQWLLAHADGRAESVGETVARLSCVNHGLAVHPQRFLAGVGRVDLVVESQVVVEVDGFRHHSDRASFRRDRKRGRAAVRHGMPVLRYAHAELLGGEPVNVGAEVKQWLVDVGAGRVIA